MDALRRAPDFDASGTPHRTLVDGAAQRRWWCGASLPSSSLPDLAAASPEPVHQRDPGRPWRPASRIRIGRHRRDERTARIFGTSISDAAGDGHEPPKPVFRRRRPGRYEDDPLRGVVGTESSRVRSCWRFLGVWVTRNVFNNLKEDDGRLKKTGARGLVARLLQRLPRVEVPSSGRGNPSRGLRSAIRNGARIANLTGPRWADGPSRSDVCAGRRAKPE